MSNTRLKSNSKVRSELVQGSWPPRELPYVSGRTNLFDGDYDYLFYAYNGTGVGHLRRVAILCRELLSTRPTLKISVVTNARHALFLSELPIEIFQTPYSSVCSETQQEASQANLHFLYSVLRLTRPQVIVCDTVFERSVVEWALFGGSKAVLIQRLISEDVLFHRIESDYYDLFDQVIFPHSVESLGGLWSRIKKSRLGEKAFADGFVFAAPSECEANHTPKYEIIATIGGGGPYFATFNGALHLKNHANIATLLLSTLAELTPRTLLGKFCFCWGPNSSEKDVEASIRSFSRPHLDIHRWIDLPAALSACELCISRCGYNTICEIINAACPAILIPRQCRTESQYERARWLAGHGACHVIDETDPSLGDQIRSLWQNEEDLDGMRKCSQSLRLSSGTLRIADRLLTIHSGKDTEECG